MNIKKDIPTSELQSYLRIATQAAEQAGNVLKHWIGKLSTIEEKEFPGELVTEADKASEQLILQILHENFPTHTILAEESGWHEMKQGGLSSNFVWMIDPLDGTTNYAHQHPMVAVSIALLFDEEPIIGVVFNPFFNELFQAVKGLGCTLNNRKIHVSTIHRLEKSLLATGFAYDRRVTTDNNYAEFCHMTHLTQGVRRAGAASLDLAYVAAGRFEGYWERGLKPWDMAAGIVLVNEAGGKASAYDEGSINLSSGRILATNGLIHQALSQELLNIHTKTNKRRKCPY